MYINFDGDLDVETLIKKISLRVSNPQLIPNETLIFLIRYNKEATTIEVKSADNTKAKSMNSIIENWNAKHGIKLSTKNVGGSQRIDSFPLYMAMFVLIIYFYKIN